jgi:transcriptional regulator with XRE-family HTH domain
MSHVPISVRFGATGESRRSIAVRAGVSHTAVARAASGADVRFSTAIRIARALGVSVEEAFAHLAPPAVEQPATPETPAQEGGA